MVTITKICPNCGKVFTYEKKDKGGRTYCDDIECIRERREKAHCKWKGVQYVPRKKRRTGSLQEDAREANRLGVTYGHYKVMQDRGEV